MGDQSSTHAAPDERRVGDADGQGLFGVLDETDEGLLCHECSRRFKHLGLHAWRGHGKSAVAYRIDHGLARSRGLVASTIREVIAENARRSMPTKTGLVAARSPRKASAAQGRGTAAISPQGLEAIRASNQSRRGRTRKGTVVTCERCGVQFCPLTAAKKRRFCSRSCASAATGTAASQVDTPSVGPGPAGRMSPCPRSSLPSSSVMSCGSPAAAI